MKQWLHKITERLQSVANHWWFVPLVAFLSALDAYILIVPNEVFLIPAVLGHRKRWLLVSVCVTAGSAAGAASFAWMTSHYGVAFLEHIMPHTLHSETWHESEAYIQRHGLWGLTLVSLSPFPQHAAVALAGLAHMNAAKVFLGVFCGRLIKYVFIAWAAVFSPDLLKRLHITK